MYNHCNLKLTKKEETIMRVLWAAGRPLSVSEICDYADEMNLSLNQSTVQMTVKKLMKYELIRVGDITQVHKVLARAFVPVMDSDEFAVMKMKHIMETAGNGKKPGFIAALLDDEDLNESDLDELSAIIEKLKKQ